MDIIVCRQQKKKSREEIMESKNEFRKQVQGFIKGAHDGYNITTRLFHVQLLNWFVTKSIPRNPECLLYIVVTNIIKLLLIYCEVLLLVFYMVATHNLTNLQSLQSFSKSIESYKAFSLGSPYVYGWHQLYAFIVCTIHLVIGKKIP